MVVGHGVKKTESHQNTAIAGRPRYFKKQTVEGSYAASEYSTAGVWFFYVSFLQCELLFALLPGGLLFSSFSASLTSC